MNETAGKKAIVLLSGGADSVTCLAYAAIKEKRKCIAVTFVYGQVHLAELEAARQAAKKYAVDHVVIELDPKPFQGSALTGRGNIPTSRTEEEIGSGIPATYVPARNLVFLSICAALAETYETREIYIGVNSIDSSGYPDCREEFIKSMEKTLEKGTKAGVEGHPPRIKAPFVNMKKSEIFRLGKELGVDYSRTVSCYKADPLGRACGKCDACLLRKKGFHEARIPDPTIYQD